MELLTIDEGAPTDVKVLLYCPPHMPRHADEHWCIDYIGGIPRKHTHYALLVAPKEVE